MGEVYGLLASGIPMTWWQAIKEAAWDMFVASIFLAVLGSLALMLRTVLR